ncbi:MAG: NAD-dependent epimerase/dehydratase family protein [Thermoleophilia bacterium]|nr:NAD-dependent epimerase/dehydratase family protein [Thermoleophilia bacterium]MDQ3859670.1 NAD-dependent epimerase/dehydratase family protein [Actinomycetota bacterium]
MNVLVTGATGFLGRHLVRRLRQRGDDVRALVRGEADERRLRGDGVDAVRGDICDPAAVRRAAHGRDLVFHAAGLVAHERRDAGRLRAANVDGVRTLLAALEPGARLVHVASLSTVGPARTPDAPAHEDQPYPEEAARLPYVVSKRAGERLVLAAVERGLDAVVANPGFLLGPGDVHRISTWPVHRYLEGTLRIQTMGGLSVADARDVADGIVALAERGRTGERYILTAADGNLPWPAFFERIGALTGVRRRMIRLPASVALVGSEIVRWPVKPGEVRLATFWWFATPAKAERELGFRSRPADETIAATAAECR